MAAALPPNDNRAPNLLCCFWVPFPFTVAIVATRFYCRGARKDFGYDDWTVLLAWMLYTVSVAMSTSMELHGGGRHAVYIGQSDLLYIGKLQIITQVPAALSAMLGKISVALFIMRISGRTSKWRRWFLSIHITIYTIITIINIAILLGQCRPIQALWDPSIKLSGNAKCLDPSVNTDITLVQSSFGAYLDFALAILPLSFIVELKIALQKRIVLCLILGLGIIAGVCACIKTSKFTEVQKNPTDPTRASFSLYIWTFLEIPLVIIAACIPPSKPIWDFLIKGRPIKPSNNSSYAAGSTNSYRIGFMKTSVHATERSKQRTASDENDHDVENLILKPGPSQNIQRTTYITQTSRERSVSRDSPPLDFTPV